MTAKPYAELTPAEKAAWHRSKVQECLLQGRHDLANQHVNKARVFEKAADPMIEAYGVKGMKSKPWRKTFKNADALNDWAEANDAEIHGTREVEK